MEFRHRILNFNPVGVLLSLGVTPYTHPLIYYELVAEVYKIIEIQVGVSGVKLNVMLKEAYRKDMYDIGEYSRFPEYIDVMNYALSEPKHMGVYWDKKNNVQAKFVDVTLLGDTADLQAIQKMVHPGGTLQGWVGVYNAWLAGTSKLYEDIIGRRLGIMLTFQMFPLWEIIEYGSGPYAYPKNPPKRTLRHFQDVYNKEMRDAYIRCITATRLLMLQPRITFREFEATTVKAGEQRFFGYKWLSKSGRTVFVIAGTEKLVGNRLVARGFFLHRLTGGVIRKWSGFLSMVK